MCSSRHAVIPSQSSTTENTAHSQSIYNRHHYRHTTNKTKESHSHSHLKKLAVTSARSHHCRDFFSQPLLISYKRDKNFNNFLDKSTLKSDHQPGSFKCARCRTCPFNSNANKISGPKRTVTITIISRAFPPISSTVLPVPYEKNIHRRNGPQIR